MHAPESLGGTLFVSGTASVVGHESRHRDDVAAQARETLRNIRALIGGEEATDGVLRDSRFSPVKVYLRRAEDRPIVQRILQDELGEATPILYLAAEICRPELLVEVEGLASEPIDARSLEFPGAS
jgi:enamine deaminase RidA (YjgF/YER057c/UK114 family)